MTVLAVIQPHAGSSVWIGSDQQVTAGDERFMTCRPKWNFGEGWAIGCAGVTALQSLAAREWESGRWSDASEFAEHFRKVVDSRGWFAHSHGANPPDRNVYLLVVHARAAYRINLGMGLADELPPGRLYAFGSGDDFATGAAHALRLLPAEHQIRAALEAAIAFDISCGGEPWIRRVDW